MLHLITMSSLKKWRTLESKYIITNRWIRLRADTCETPDGHTFDDWYILECPDWLSCVVLSEDLQEITLLRHYRHGIQDFVLEVPGAIIEEGETPKQTLVRELKEEIGLSNAEIIKIGTVYPNPDKQTNKDHCFLAIGGEYGKSHPEPGETLEMLKMPLAELLKKIDDQKIIMQSMHLSAIFLALNYLKKQGRL